jgi:hypothetical protein
VNNITNGNFIYKPTSSANHLVNHNEAIYRNDSFARFNAAKDTRKQSIYDVPYSKPIRHDNQTMMKPTNNDIRHSFPSDSSGPEKVFGYMYNLWRTGKLCDIIILTKSADILAHKVTLAAYSDFLAEKFTEFSQGEVLNIDLTDVNEEIVRTVISFVYTNEINISDTNVVDILYCAEEIGILVVSNMCMEHISRAINPQNAFNFFSAAHQRNLDQVKQKVMKYITENFKSITSRSEFGMMPFDILILLLYSDDLGIDSEIDVFVAIVRWVDHNRKERIRLAPSLLKCIRFQLIEVNFVITHIESADWMFRPRECHDWLYDVLR